MRNLFIFLLLFSFTTSLSIFAQTKKSDIADPNKFQKIETDKKVPVCRGSLKTCGEKALVALEMAGFGGPEYIKTTTETFSFKNGVGIFLLTIKGIKDPLIKGERTRLAFKKSGRNYRFVQAGRQYLCASGQNANVWKKECSPESEKPATDYNEIRSDSNFRFLSINGRAVGEATKPCSDTLRECGTQKIIFYGIKGFAENENNDHWEEVFFSSSAGDGSSPKTTGIYLLTINNIEDDSISAERYRLEFIRKENSWELVQGGKQFKCRRGEKAGKWTKDNCP